MEIHPSAPPRLETRAVKHGEGWFVLVTWSNGRTAQIDGFADEPEAAQWIKISAAAWLTGRQTGSHG